MGMQAVSCFSAALGIGLLARVAHRVLRSCGQHAPCRGGAGVLSTTKPRGQLRSSLARASEEPLHCIVLVDPRVTKTRESRSR